MKRLLLPLAISLLYMTLGGCSHSEVNLGVGVGVGVSLYHSQGDIE